MSDVQDYENATVSAVTELGKFLGDEGQAFVAGALGYVNNFVKAITNLPQDITQVENDYKTYGLLSLRTGEDALKAIDDGAFVLTGALALFGVVAAAIADAPGLAGVGVISLSLTTIDALGVIAERNFILAIKTGSFASALSAFNTFITYATKSFNTLSEQLASLGPSITVPTGGSDTVDDKVSINGISISDPLAVGNYDSLEVYISANSGTVALTDVSGATISGSSTKLIKVSGSLEQINEDIARLTYTAGSTPGADNISVAVFDQFNSPVSKSFNVVVQAAPPAPTPATATVHGSPTANVTESWGPDTNVSFSDAQYAFTINSGPIDLVYGSGLDAIGGDYTFQWAGFNTVTVLAANGQPFEVLHYGDPLATLPSGATAILSDDPNYVAYDANGDALTISSPDPGATVSVTINGGPWEIGIPDTAGGGVEVDFSDSAGGTTPTIPTPTPTPTPIPAPTPTPTPAAPMIAVPGTETVTAETTTTFSGVSISDPSAIGAADSLTLTLSASSGTISMDNGSGGAALAGSGTGTITVSGSLEQLNADLATLAYAAGNSAGSASVALNVTDQAGITTTGTIGVTVNAAPTPTPTPTPTGFDGDQFSLDIYDPSISAANLVDSGTATVVPGTTMFPSLSNLGVTDQNSAGVVALGGSATIDGDTISFLYPAGGGSFNSGAFNGYVFTDLGAQAGNILGAMLTSTNITGLTASDLSFTPDSVSLNVAGLTLPTTAQGSIVIGVDFANQTTSASSLIAHPST